VTGSKPFNMGPLKEVGDKVGSSEKVFGVCIFPSKQVGASDDSRTEE
jgi:hypothetical protein